MKLQEVILRAIAKKISWVEAAEIAGLSPLTIGRIRQKYEDFGYDGLYDQQRNKRHFHRVPLSLAESVLVLYQQAYSGLSAHRFHQQLGSQHRIRLPYSWVKQALEGAGLIATPKKRHTPRANSRPRARGHRHFVRSASLQ